MRFLFLFSTFLLVKSAPHGMEDEEFPFKTDNFPKLLDDRTLRSDGEKEELTNNYSDQADTLNKPTKAKSLFNKNGPPGIGADLFSNAAVEENIKKLSYEGSGEAIEHSEPSTTTDYFGTGNNNLTEDAAVESTSNSSTAYDQNTSVAQVEMVSDRLYKNIEAEISSKTKETQTNYDGHKDDAAVETGTQSITNTNISNTNMKKPCHPPPSCRKNCFVSLNENGCQDCQCLWIAEDCTTDKDCSEKNQYCDMGKCNCQLGFKQNMQKSGVCEQQHSSNKENMTALPYHVVSNEVDENKISSERLKRTKRASKPRHSERLEWPGVCDKNEQCPDNLVCINGDCWSVPEKMRRFDASPKSSAMFISRNTDEENETKRVSFDTEEITEPITQSTANLITMPTTVHQHTVTESSKRGMARFVSEDFAKQLQRTTARIRNYDWFPPTTTLTTPTTQFRRTTKVSSTAPPLTVDKFFIIETTVAPISLPLGSKTMENDHKMEYLKERKPNFLGVKEESQELEDQFSPQPHIKKIHLEMPPSLTPQRRKAKKIKMATPTPDDASEVEEMNSVDEVEFPISSKINIGLKKPRALSAQPTREELKDHKSLVDLFNSHAAKISEKKSIVAKPSFPILQSLSSPGQTPDIQISLATEDHESKLSPTPDLLNEGNHDSERKPWMIQLGKIHNIAPLNDIKEEMASDDPPEIPFEPTSFQQHQMGVWYPMKKGDIPHLGIFSGEFRKSPIKQIKTESDSRLYNEYTKANRFNRPIRIEMDNAAEYVRNECQNDSNCGNHTVCCTKKWCDRTDNCGTGNFCLTTCSSTKLTFLPSSNRAESVIDIMYD